jgi:hypothetical protein
VALRMQDITDDRSRFFRISHRSSFWWILVSRSARKCWSKFGTEGSEAPWLPRHDQPGLDAAGHSGIGSLVPSGCARCGVDQVQYIPFGPQEDANLDLPWQGFRTAQGGVGDRCPIPRNSFALQWFFQQPDVRLWKLPFALCVAATIAPKTSKPLRSFRPLSLPVRARSVVACFSLHPTICEAE